jgi:putative transcriptional regulator
MVNRTTRSKTEKLSPVAEAILEVADDMHRIGIMGDADYNKITMRHLGKARMATAEPIAAEDIRKMRQRARMSQAVFARHLNVTTGYVSQLERGVKRPTGAALTLLNVIRRKGMEAIL